MKLYAVCDGPPSFAVRMLLKKLKLEYELIDVDYCAGEHMTDDYAKMNPQKEIPVLDDDGFYLGESNAILQYLMDKYAPESDMYPKEPLARALVNHRLCFNLSFFYPSIFQYVILPMFFAYDRSEYRLSRVHISLTAFETYLKSSGTKYAAANHLTIADFPLVASVMCLEAIKFNFSDEYPHIARWYANFKAENPEIWQEAELGMRMTEYYEKNNPDVSHLNHPLYPKKSLIEHETIFK
ncbi:glutathione S-transferase 1-like [Culicoides brevitarsis]|uniref:glutathione S-transferase 1-like n=1 Tax=Culicoides brevitarsis TaxID=469753 RepID=UPI00307C1C19